MSFLYFPVFGFGQVNVKFNSDSLFSERNNKVPTVVLLGIRFTWRGRR